MSDLKLSANNAISDCEVTPNAHGSRLRIDAAYEGRIEFRTTVVGVQPIHLLFYVGELGVAESTHAGMVQKYLLECSLTGQELLLAT